jgi:hypothetical protein
MSLILLPQTKYIRTRNILGNATITGDLMLQKYQLQLLNTETSYISENKMNHLGEVTFISFCVH